MTAESLGESAEKSGHYSVTVTVAAFEVQA
jgi:hypothetical protein